MNHPQRLSAWTQRVVRCLEPRQHLFDDRQRVRHWETLCRLHEFGERLAVQVLHDQKELILKRNELENRNDVGVRDARADPRFIHEHLQELGVAREMWMEPFDRHDP